MSRRERREVERARRERRPGASGAKGGGRKGLWVAGALVVLAIAAFASGRALGVFAPAPTAAFAVDAPKYDAATETIGTHEADESNAHIPVGEKATYKTDPPTSGTHWNQPGLAPAPWGIKDATLPNEVVVHNLEHGGIVIFYKDLSATDLATVRQLARDLMQNGYPKIVVEPYPLTDSKIALSAWRWQLKLQSYDDVPIVKFVKQHYEGPDAPEPQTM
jgi:uncharacterized protein DUF3105